MQYPKRIEGQLVNLRSITLSDAEFSYQIRKDPIFHGLVGCLAPTLESQKEYIRKQMEKPGDYYFVIEDKKGNRIGLMGVYDIKGDVGEVGRTISYGDSAQNLEAGFLIGEFEREVLGLNKVYCVVYEENTTTVHLNKRIGFHEIGRDIRSGKPCVLLEASCAKENKGRLRVVKTLNRFLGGEVYE